LIRAYDILHKFELSASEAQTGQNIKNPSHWILESIGWASLYEEVMGVDLDADIPVLRERIATFSQFALSCTAPNVAVAEKKSSILQIYFSDSSRTRKDMLVHVFKPLLADVFSFKAVYSVFDSLSIHDNVAYLSKCFGEWIMAVSVKDLYHKGLLTDQSPLHRFLDDLATRQMDGDDFNDSDVVVLGVLHSFCTEATDLVRAFMLSVLCRESVETASSRKEKQTYGKILSSHVVSAWDDLLRKLRVCLLVSIRLRDAPHPAPLSVHNVNEDGLFSVFEWLAYDELRTTHKQDEILSIEVACKMSSHTFSPSTVDGDGPSRFKQMKNSCLELVMDDEERAEYFMDSDDHDRFGSLLLFFPNHNEHLVLVAHRARILAAEWGKAPSNLEVLQDALDALSSLHKCSDMSPLAIALCLDIWISRICPIYRAQLFGFDFVHEVSEETIEPLLHDDEWFAAFGRACLRILDMLKTSWSDNGSMILEALFSANETDNGWPPVRMDHILKKLVDKSRKVDDSALKAHVAIACALLVSKDTSALVNCVPSIYECFLSDSLFNPLANPSGVESVRKAFIEEAILGRARSYDGAVMDRFALEAIDALCMIWEFDIREARTLFLLAMYEVGKDRIVDELLTRYTQDINVNRFIEGGVDIACRRLHAFLNGREMKSPEMRETIGLLDADLCEWIRHRARNSKPKIPLLLDSVSIGQTHLFCLRLLSLCASSGEDNGLRVKIHSATVMSGTLVKILEMKSGTSLHGDLIR